MKYLAGAYRAAGGSEGSAVANYARGYYRQAKSLNVSPYEAPGPATVAFSQGTRTRFGAIVSMAADRHAVF